MNVSARCVRLILAVSAVTGATACQSPEQVEDRLVLAFEEAILDRAPHRGDSARGTDRLTRWNGAVRVRIAEGASPATEARARQTLSEFEELTGVQITWPESAEQEVDLAIHFSSRSHFVLGTETVTCYAKVLSRDNGEIAAAEIHIGRNGENSWRDICLPHELLHAFGWRGHTHRVQSANSYMHDVTELSRWDRLLLRTQYDARLEPGIPREEAISIARTILRELLSEGAR